MRRTVCAALAALLAIAATRPVAAAGTESEPAARPAANADYDIGKAAVEKGDFPRAIEALRRAVASDPRNANAFNLLGFATRKSGDPRGSLQYYQQALTIDPKHIGAHEYIGEAYLMLDDVAQARQHLARLDQLCIFGCKEHRMLKDAIAAHQKGIKPK
ncbi:tetratricopeptide repeat protein [Vineibacter terrae]|uniref:Tetratricopeptide repeat protein n=1 Tax=Vineibacter terrae TaxID=2586908 RepID=A0A5C8PEP3_9HYPH|nr:tetratricopeptide repeat protein [Vineibacter terrae]TXL72076.1 tetratricopeptide repeat protein [Vineibacter terrae]